MLLGLTYWPVTLVLFTSVLVVAIVTRRLVRVVAGVFAVALGLELCVAIVFSLDGARRNSEVTAFEARIDQTLTKDQEVDGLPLPAGSEMVWTDESRKHLRYVGLPRPTRLLGVQAIYIGRHGDFTGKDWDLQFASPQVVDGWTCDRAGAELTPTGHLLSCTLAAPRRWNGWPLPAGSAIEPDLASGHLKLALTGQASVPAPEIGHAITATGQMSFNSDGSLDTFYFKDSDPLVVRGVTLWNTVSWTYLPGTLGQGRRRRAVAVNGATLASSSPSGSREVRVRVSDGHVDFTDG